MEAVGAASSVTALLTIAVQSSKTIYETVTTIRHGPAELESLAHAADELHRLLKQIIDFTSRQVESNYGGHTELAGLKQSIRSCIDDLQVVQQELQKSRPRAQEGALGRARKRMMLVIKKEDVERMWGLIQRQTNKLSLQIDIGNM